MQNPAEVAEDILFSNTIVENQFFGEMRSLRGCLF